MPSDTYVNQLRQERRNWQEWEVDNAEDAAYRQQHIDRLTATIDRHVSEQDLYYAWARLSNTNRQWWEDDFDPDDIALVVAALKECKGWT